MLQSHLGSIFNLSQRTTKELTSSGGRHRTSDSHFALASHLRSADRGVRTHNIPKETCRSQSTQYSLIRKVARVLQVIEYSRYYTTGATCGSCNDEPSGSVLFAHGKSIGIYFTTRAHALRIAQGAHHIFRRLPS